MVENDSGRSPDSVEKVDYDASYDPISHLRSMYPQADKDDEKGSDMRDNEEGIMCVSEGSCGANCHEEERGKCNNAVDDVSLASAVRIDRWLVDVDWTIVSVYGLVDAVGTDCARQHEQL